MVLGGRPGKHREICTQPLDRRQAVAEIFRIDLDDDLCDVCLAAELEQFRQPFVKAPRGERPSQGVSGGARGGRHDRHPANRALRKYRGALAGFTTGHLRARVISRSKCEF